MADAARHSTRNTSVKLSKCPYRQRWTVDLMSCATDNSEMQTDLTCHLGSVRSAMVS
jgi:hypothetical protein